MLSTRFSSLPKSVAMPKKNCLIQGFRGNVEQAQGNFFASKKVVSVSSRKRFLKSFLRSNAREKFSSCGIHPFSLCLKEAKVKVFVFVSSAAAE